MRITRRFRGLRGESGNSVLEVAVIIFIFGIPLIIGTSEMAAAVYASIEVANAANAGASYGMQSATFAANTAGIRSAAIAEAADFTTSSITVTPTTYYVCSNAVGGTQYTGSNAQSDATAACAGSSNRAVEFVKVTTSATVTPAMHLPALPAAFTLTGSAAMEVEQ